MYDVQAFKATISISFPDSRDSMSPKKDSFESLIAYQKAKPRT